MVRSQRLPELLILALILASFAGGIELYRTLYPDLFDYLTSDEVALGFLTSVVTFWLAVRLAGWDIGNGEWLQLARAFCIGTGLNLILQAGFNYLDILPRSMFLMVVGGLIAVALLTVAGWLAPVDAGVFRPRTVMVGFDSVAAELVRLLPYPLAAVIGDVAYPPGSAPIPYADLGSVLAEIQPQQIIVTAGGAERVDASALLAQRLNGARVSSSAELYEELFGRVCCSGRAPVDLLLSPALSGNQQAMVVQAVYTNLLGLILLIAVSPVLACVIGLRLLSRSGPVLEAQQCYGFHNIPFLRLRFRTRSNDSRRSRDRIGRLMERLHLADLPSLLNVIRGEMALFGPKPVRCEFADRLSEIFPFYSMRFAVKPGMIDWERAQTRSSRAGALKGIEYDLYYVKHASPWLDFEILMRLLLRERRPEAAATELAPAA